MSVWRRDIFGLGNPLTNLVLVAKKEGGYCRLPWGITIGEKFIETPAASALPLATFAMVARSQTVKFEI